MSKKLDEPLNLDFGISNSVSPNLPFRLDESEDIEPKNKHCETIESELKEVRKENRILEKTIRYLSEQIYLRDLEIKDLKDLDDT